jgi:hypothetical protein
MPQYIRENGAIKVIPDDNTTEDGEIDLSPTRKIIDEGDIILEGRDDGSTVIREKRPEDHTFLTNKRTVKLEGGEDFQESNSRYISRYIKKNDKLLFSKGTNGLYILDAENLQYTKKLDKFDISLSDGSFLVSIHQPTGKIFLSGSNSSSVLIFNVNESTGNYEKTGEITLFVNESTGEEESSVNGSICLDYLNKLIFIGKKQVTFVDPISESQIGKTETGTGIDSIGNINSQPKGYKRSDRILFMAESGETILVDPISQSATDLSSVLGENVVDLVYVPRIDEFYGETNSSFGEIESIDVVNIKGSTLEKSIRSYPGKDKRLLRPLQVIEDRFIISTVGSDRSSSDFNLELIDPKTNTVVDGISGREDDENNLLSLISVAFDSKRNRLVYYENYGETNLSAKLGIVDYNPFYD